MNWVTAACRRAVLKKDELEVLGATSQINLRRQGNVGHVIKKIIKFKHFNIWEVPGLEIGTTSRRVFRDDRLAVVNQIYSGAAVLPEGRRDNECGSLGMAAKCARSPAGMKSNNLSMY